MAGTDLGLYIERPEQLLRERVVDTVREAIVRGALAPGRRLTERELVGLTGVSRTSLREALRHLEAEGLLERSGSRGLRVAVLTEPVVSQLYDVRAVLEPAAVEMFVRNASDEQVAALVEAAGDLEAPFAAQDLEEQLAARRAFYGVLLDGTGNAVMQEILGSIEVRIHSLRRLSLRVAGRGEESRRQFRELVGWIQGRDAGRAAQTAKAYVMAAKAAALAAVKDMHAASGE